MTTDVINGVPRELLRIIEQSWRVPNGCPASVSEHVEEIIKNGLAELRALLTAQPQASAAQSAAMAPEELLSRCAEWCDKNPKQPWYGRTAGDMVRTFMACQPLSAQSAADGEREAQESADDAFRVWERDGNPISGANGYMAAKAGFRAGAEWQARAAQPQQAVAVTDEVRRLLEDLAQYAPAAGVLCAPTAAMGFGSRAKRILSALSAHKTGEEE